MTEPSSFLWPEEVAEVLMLHLETVYELVEWGVLPSCRLPGNGPVVPRAMLPPFEKTTEHWT
jgi:excisionase family DNA binding protein